MSPTFVDLYSGIGLLSKAWELAGWECVGHCEINPDARKVLEYNWPDVPLVESDEDVTRESFPRPDAIIGGPPCEAASLAGKGLGAADPRWRWPEAIRIVEAFKPRWICFENPPGMVRVGLDRVLAELEGLGYRFPEALGGQRVIPEIPAAASGAAHGRYRLWIVANRDSPQRRRGWELPTDAKRRNANKPLANPDSRKRQPPDKDEAVRAGRSARAQLAGDAPDRPLGNDIGTGLERGNGDTGSHPGHEGSPQGKATEQATGVDFIWCEWDQRYRRLPEGFLAAVGLLGDGGLSLPFRFDGRRSPYTPLISGLGKGVHVPTARRVAEAILEVEETL